MKVFSKRALRRRLLEDRHDLLDTLSSRRSHGTAFKSVVVGGVVLLGLAWAAPMLVGYTPLRNEVLRWALPEFRGSVQAGSASLGWFSDVKLYDVELRDESGGQIAKIPAITVDRTLLSLAGGDSLGQITLDRPQVYCRFDDESSNLEQFAAQWLEQEDDTLTIPAFSLQIAGGTLHIEDDATEGKWQVDDLRGKCSVGQNWTAPLVVQLNGKLDEPGRKGSVDVDLTVRRKAKKGGAESSGKLLLSAEQAPLAALEPVLKRSMPESALVGWLSGKLQFAWGADGQDAAGGHRIHADVTAEDFEWYSPALGQETLRLKRLRVPCKLALDDEGIYVEEFALGCDLGEVVLDGSLDIRYADHLGNDVLQALMRESYAIRGTVDLAALAAQLPGMLKVREGTQITSGDLTVELSRRMRRDGAVWAGRVDTSNLTAINDGRQIAWDQPIHVDFSARETPEGIAIEKLNCDAEFLDLEAAGNREFFSISAEYNLERLVQELGQFLDLSQCRLSGDGWSFVSWRQTATGRFEAEFQNQVDNFQFMVPGGKSVRERKLMLAAKFTGSAQGWNIQRIDEGDIRMESGKDRCLGKLMQPMDGVRRNSVWPLLLELEGNLARWMARWEAMLGAETVQLDGNGQLLVSVFISPDQVQFEQGEVALQQFRVFSSDWSIQEPKLEARWAGRWTPAARRAEIEQLEIQCDSLFLEAHKARLTLPARGMPRFMGDWRFSGDMAKLQYWLPDADQPYAPRFGGMVQGTLKVSQTGQGNFLEWRCAIDRPQIESASGGKWSQVRAACNGSGRYDSGSDVLLLDAIELNVESREGNTLHLEAQGKVQDPTDTCQIHLEGYYDYDTQRLLELARPWIGEGVTVNAKRSPQPFVLRGPFAAITQASEKPKDGRTPPVAELLAAAQVEWTGADVYGFKCGAGQLIARLRDGVVHVDPLDIAVSGGRLTAAPKLDFVADPAVFTMQPGMLLHHVRVTPEMCRRGLKYLAPLLANATQAQGEFSMDIGGSYVPLTDPGSGEVAGKITVHNLEIGPGPMLQMLASVVDVVRGKPPGTMPLKYARLKQESTILYRMVQGRVYHQNVQMEFDGVTVTTFGSVGLDQSLEMMARIGLPKQVGRLPILGGLAQAELEIPISGTLDQPKIDHTKLAPGLLKVFNEESLNQIPGTERLRDALREETGEVLNKLNEGINKLLPGK